MSLKFERKNKLCPKIIQYELLLPGSLFTVAKYLTCVSLMAIGPNSQLELFGP